MSPHELLARVRSYLISAVRHWCYDLHGGCRVAELRERIADVARNHHRSMNSEIIARLEQSMLQEGALDDDLSLL